MSVSSGPGKEPEDFRPDHTDLSKAHAPPPDIVQRRSGWLYSWIVGDKQLQQAFISLRREDEYVSLAIKRYPAASNFAGGTDPCYPISLIQIGLPLQGRALIIDPASLSNLDLLRKFLENPHPRKIIFRPEELIQSFRANNIEIQGVLSVGDWARLLRPDYPNWSFEALVLRELGVLTDVRLRDSDWTHREYGSGKLTDSQMHYATLEVEFLARLAACMQSIHDEATLPRGDDLDFLITELEQTLEARSNMREEWSPRLAKLDAEIIMLSTSVEREIRDTSGHLRTLMPDLEYRHLYLPEEFRDISPVIRTNALASNLEGDRVRGYRSYQTTLSHALQSSSNYQFIDLAKKLEQLAFFKDQRLTYLDPRDARLLAVAEYRARRIEEMLIKSLKARGLSSFRGERGEVHISTKYQNDGREIIANVPDPLTLRLSK